MAAEKPSFLAGDYVPLFQQTRITASGHTGTATPACGSGVDLKPVGGVHDGFKVAPRPAPQHTQLARRRSLRVDRRLPSHAQKALAWFQLTLITG